MNAKVLPFLFALALMLALALGAGPLTALAAEGDSCDFDGGVDNGRIINGSIGGEICFPLAAVDALAKCRETGWSFFAFEYSVAGSSFVGINCNVYNRDYANYAEHGDSENYVDNVGCALYRNAEERALPPCADIFGAGFRLPVSDGGDDQTFIYNCPVGMIPDPEYVSGGVQECVAWDNKKVCETILDGDLQTAADGTTEICSGVDAADTFCILGEESVFPCRGLLRHARQCNHAYNRPALNPFLCAPVCPTNKVAVGGACECGAGLTPDGDDCVPE